MKKTRLITALIALLFFSNVLNAVNPSKGNAGKKPNMMVEKLGKDIVLTEEQKAKIESRVKIFTEKMKGANNLSDRKELISVKKEFSAEYKVALDSILTKEQKEQLAVKQNERKEAIIKKYQTSK